MGTQGPTTSQPKYILENTSYPPGPGMKISVLWHLLQHPHLPGMASERGSTGAFWRKTPRMPPDAIPFQSSSTGFGPIPFQSSSTGFGPLRPDPQNPVANTDEDDKMTPTNLPPRGKARGASKRSRTYLSNAVHPAMAIRHLLGTVSAPEFRDAL